MTIRIWDDELRRYIEAESLFDGRNLLRRADDDGAAWSGAGSLNGISSRGHGRSDLPGSRDMKRVRKAQARRAQA